MNPVTFGKNNFCGPAVISSITGISTDAAELHIQLLRRNSKKVKGAYTSELCEVLERLNYRTTYLTHLSHCGSVFYLLSVLEAGTYIIVVPGHFICIEITDTAKYICDNHTKKPININSSARLSQQVHQVVKVELKGVVL